MWRNKLDLSVYLVTNDGVAGQRGRTTEEVVLDAVRGGATIVQIREKDLPLTQLADLTARVKPIAHAHSVPIVVNDSVWTALEVGADGVHLGQSDMPAHLARRILGSERILGVSVYTVEEALTAQRADADYVSISPVFATKTKKDARPPMGLEQMSLIARVVTIPVIAIGGIVHANAAQVVRAGLDGVAVISAIIDQPAQAKATRDLSEIVRATKQNIRRGAIML
jgi:thiamine-phosphate pyrophosphorylase